MRKDLAKVLCERERPESKDKYSRHRGKIENKYFKDPETSPTHLSRTDIYGYKHSFNENLAPLFGFLRKAVNRKWDDVYSEISSTFKKDSVINQHVHQHIWDIIQKDCKCDENGNVFFIKEYSWNNEGWIPIDESRAELYIHPITGYLLKIDKVSKKKREIDNALAEEKEIAKYYRFMNDYTRLIRLGGVWYEFKFEKVITREVWRSVRNYQTMELEVKLVKETSPLSCSADAAINGALIKEGYDPYGSRVPFYHPLIKIKSKIKYLGFGRYRVPVNEIKAVSKRQLNSKELKRLGLT